MLSAGSAENICRTVLIGYPVYQVVLSHLGKRGDFGAIARVVA